MTKKRQINDICLSPLNGLPLYFNINEFKGLKVISNI